MIKDRVEAILEKYKKECQCWRLYRTKIDPGAVVLYRDAGSNSPGVYATVNRLRMDLTPTETAPVHLTHAETRLLLDVQQTIEAIVGDENAQHRAAERAAENLVKTAGTVQELIDELLALPPVLFLTLAADPSIRLAASNPLCGGSVLCLGKEGLYVNQRECPISLSVVDDESSYVDLRLMKSSIDATLRLQFWLHSLATGENVPLRITQPY